MNYRVITLTVLFCILAMSMLPLSTYAQTEVSIIQTSTLSGTKGDTIRLMGTISTAGGAYQVLLGNNLVASGTATGIFETSFTVPSLPAATYPLRLRDVRTNTEATTDFTVTRGYTISVSPSTIQEDSTVKITASVNGIAQGASVGAKVSVVSPKGETYTTEISLGTPNAEGTASKTVMFPSNDFSPSGSTLAAGRYTATLNGTLAMEDFLVSILDATEYHRGQTMQIHANGYGANQAATITISGVKGTLATLSVTANSDGKIDTSWVISADAPIGEGSVKITVADNQKDSTDRQIFRIIGYTVDVTVTNLAGTAIPDINVYCVDQATSAQYNETSNQEGQVSFGLEKGAHTLTAYWNEVKVGTSDITVTGDENFTLQCQLTDLKVTVKTQDGTAMPFVNIGISYEYGSPSKTGTAFGQTGGAGYYTLASTLTGATYTINASLYDKVFNAGNDTISVSDHKATTEVTIICPSKDISLSVTGYDNQAIAGARIELVELSNGLFYSATTDSSGVVNTNATFGTYRLRVYKDNALLDESSLRVFGETRRQIQCTLYGIELTVSVVDFFGSPVSNAHVTLNGAEATSTVTDSAGKATFSNIVGGNMQIITEIQGNPEASQALTITIDQPTTLQVKLEKYVSVGGMLLQANTLITLIIVAIIAVLFIVLEIVRRHRTKPAATT